MTQGPITETALGVARGRFIEGLGRKAEELRAAIALLVATPAAERPREELRRRLHALYASAQVFRMEPLAGALREAIGRLDAARDDERDLDQDDLDALTHLVATLPALAGTTAAPAASVSPPASVVPAPPPAQVSSAPRPSARTAERPVGKATTIQGMPPKPVARPAESVEGVPRPSGTFTVAAQAGSRMAARARTPLQTVISVLLVEEAAWQARVRAALSPERFEVLSSDDPEDALRLARSSAPDVVVVDSRLLLDAKLDFLARLRSDPLTDFVPVLALTSEGAQVDGAVLRKAGADDVLAKPLDPDRLTRTLAKLTGTASDAAPPFESFDDLTVEEIADRMAQEIRRGLVESVESGRDVSVPLGEGTEVLAAAWSAVARLRAHLAQKSGGRLRFRDSPRRGGPALMALADGEVTSATTVPDVDLTGRRILVVDDDPAVVWFFAGLLREEGATVVEADDGERALAAARARRPDVIISDILMPRMDGFALCRALRRDPALVDVPVILLSWKEDFLQRMRELKSGAQGYLRKEAGSAQILLRVREVLRPRARLEAQLRAGGEVRGRIEGLGVLPLLWTVAEERPNARVTIRDAWNLFEVDAREGVLSEVTRTAVDGSFSRGVAVLPQLVGCTAGRFTVVESVSPMRGTIESPLEETLERAATSLGALLDAVSGRGLSRAASLEFDSEVTSAWLSTSPAHVRELVERMQRGAGPRQLLLGGDVAPQTLEAVLDDLARRGALRSVRGEGGEDLVQEALAIHEAERERAQSEVLDGGLESASTVVSERPATRAQEDAAEDPTREVPALSDLAAQDEARRSTPEVRDPGAPDPGALEHGAFAAVSVAPEGPLGTLDAPFEDDASAEAESVTSPRAFAPAGMSIATPSLPSDPAEASVAPAATTAEAPSAETARPEAEAPSGGAPPVLPPRTSVPKATPPPTPADAKSRAARATPPQVPADARRAKPMPPEPSANGLKWILAVALFGLVGFFGWRALTPTASSRSGLKRERVSAPSSASAPGTSAGREPAGEASAPSRAELSFGTRLPHVRRHHARVGAGEGLLRVSDPAGGAEVRIGETGDFAAIPLETALPEGRHELVFRRGDTTTYRFLYLKAGQTAVVEAPVP